jgi:hypothetical protein
MKTGVGVDIGSIVVGGAGLPAGGGNGATYLKVDGNFVNIDGKLIAVRRA